LFWSVVRSLSSFSIVIVVISSSFTSFLAFNLWLTISIVRFSVVVSWSIFTFWSIASISLSLLSSFLTLLPFSWFAFNCSLRLSSLLFFSFLFSNNFNYLGGFDFNWLFNFNWFRNWFWNSLDFSWDFWNFFNNWFWLNLLNFLGWVLFDQSCQRFFKFIIGSKFSQNF
jgi:hypothetical protein